MTMESGIHNFLAQLAASDVRLRLDQGALKLNAPAELLQDPVVAGLIDELKSRKDEVIRFLQRQSSAEGDAVAPAGREQPPPLSFGQQRLWFLDQLEGGGQGYNMPTAMRLQGPLDVDALRKSLRALMVRHEVLRTRYPDSEAVFVEPLPCVELTELDLSALPAAEQDRRIQELAASAAFEPFNLKLGPMLRMQLLRKGAQDHVLLITLHHIVTDGWSIGVMVEEISALYNAISQNRPPALPALPIQYGDYAAWQQRRYSRDASPPELEWWLPRLLGAPLRLELPLDHPRPPVQHFHGDVEHFTIPATLLQPLKDLCRRHNLTLYMATLAAFGVLAARHSGQDDLLIGSPVANRNRREVEGLLGYFANTLPLRLRPGACATTSEYLDQVRDFCAGAMERQELPFEKLVEALRPERDLSHNPLVQVIFALQNSPRHTPHPELSLRGLLIEPLALKRRNVSVDLEVHLWEVDGELQGQFVYNSSLFEAATIRRMIGHYRKLLAELPRGLNTPPLRLPMLTAAEAQQWNDAAATAKNLPSDRRMTDLLREATLAHPHKTAVICGDERISYLELDRRATLLALQLQHLGVAPDTLVAVYMGRSVDMIAALVGVLKSGAAYLPIDPANPRDRIADMLASAGAALVVTHSDLALDLPDGCTLVRLDRLLRNDPECSDPLRHLHEVDHLSRQPCRCGLPTPGNPARPDHLAYAIFTSGSTGAPKATPIEHRNVLNMLAALQPIVKFSADDVWTLFHSYAFDFSVWEIWGCLLYGGTLLVTTEEERHNPHALARLLRRENATVLNLTPSNMEKLLAATREDDAFPYRLRAFCCGGEAFPGRLVSPILKFGLPVWNFYGPTEATVWSSIHRVTGADAELATLPIGAPLANYQLYVVDAFGEPAPAGVAGELCIGGAGVTRGYLGRPELNAERFVHMTHPLCRGRVYKTGDLVRRRADGAIDYLGRSDFQIKLRGFRIEPGEIESLLTEHALVNQAVVCKQYAEDGGEYLAAFLVPRRAPDDPASLFEELRKLARSKLPEYMAPTSYMILSELPLNSNGKIDRKRLPQATPNRVSSALFQAPRNRLEQEIAAIWRDVLGQERISIHDNFFDIGGYSLLLTRVYERLLRLELRTPLTALFNYPTIAQLAAHLADQAGGGEESERAALRDSVAQRVDRQRQARRRQADARAVSQSLPIK
ncbi:amino acid adenylation domain-containing protein [Hahella sp. KA22]|nr:amino acid adenylation domain-containing protein [Hahella sp. KA22]QAY56232.1 amino acid adenylation domain-containing protein [Hahella sp. KA22]